MKNKPLRNRSGKPGSCLERVMEKFGLNIAQILLAPDDTEKEENI